MKTIVALISCGTLIAAAISPALAAPIKQQRGYVHAEPYRPIHRNFGGDPSFGNRGAINYAKQTGRCVADLGYGRFEYCGW